MKKKMMSKTLVEIVVQLLLHAMLVVVVKGSLFSMLSSSRRCHFDPVIADAAMDALVVCRGST